MAATFFALVEEVSALSICYGNNLNQSVREILGRLLTRLRHIKIMESYT